MMFLLFYISLWNSYKQSIKTTLSSTISSTLEKNALDQCLCVWSMYQNKVQKQCFLQKDGLLTRWEWVLGESTFLQSIKQPHWPSHSIIQITQLHQTRQKPKKKKKTTLLNSIFRFHIFASHFPWTSEFRLKRLISICLRIYSILFLPFWR